jgi:hypothetical protein
LASATPGVQAAKQRVVDRFIHRRRRTDGAHRRPSPVPTNLRRCLVTLTGRRADPARPFQEIPLDLTAPLKVSDGGTVNNDKNVSHVTPSGLFVSGMHAP